jgi:hypothetical protein
MIQALGHLGPQKPIAAPWNKATGASGRTARPEIGQMVLTVSTAVGRADGLRWPL